MRIAILGGGFAGLTAGYYAAAKGHKVVLYERDKNLGGLASGFKEESWNWPLERAYHHIFTNDTDILNFAKDIGFTDFFFTSPETSSLYQVKEHTYKAFRLDSPFDLLKFPLLSIPERLRAGMVLGWLKFFPFLTAYEKQSASDFLKSNMGDKAWNVLFAELFRKKFGKYAEKILASFIWARITKRTKQLGYIKGGFQTFVDYTENAVKEKGVKIMKGTGVTSLKKKEEGFEIEVMDEKGNKKTEYFDKIICTLPTPVIAMIGKGFFPDDYIAKLKKIEYLSALNLIIETEQPILDKTYWLSVCVKEFPMMVMVQHTNMIDKKHYGNKHLLYVGNYLENDSKLMKMKGNELLAHFKPYLEKINPDVNLFKMKTYDFRAGFAQPIFDANFLKNKPDFITPVKNFIIANLDMTYPYDRGTNYAVQLGKKAAEML